MRDEAPAPAGPAGDARLAVVIPTLNEAAVLPGLLDDLAGLSLPHRVVVVDGGSTDRTPETARARGARIVPSSPGRARQLRRGADATEAPWLLFLHADTRLPERARRELERWLPLAPARRAAVFRFALAGDRWYWRLLEMGQRLRQRLFGLPYGDQGLVVSREAYEDAGGYPEIPIMEDVELVRRLRRRGEVVTLPAPLVSSPRRYRREGSVYGWLRNSVLIALHLAGVPPDRLARWYRPEPGPGATSRGPAPTLLVFAKAPQPGRVKTRLAADIGPERAAELYREMGRAVVGSVARGPYRTVICYDPPGARNAVRAWLGPVAGADAEFRPQAPGGLGARLREAFREAFREGGGPVCAIGTDAPDVDASLVRRAFRALRDRDVVVGPATDGGYYLVGSAREEPELFREIPWSTGEVLERTRRRARRLGWSVAELPPLSDVDTIDDLGGVGGSVR